MKKSNNYADAISSAVALKAKNIFYKYIMRKSIEKGLFYSHGRLNLGDSMVPWLIEKVSGVNYQYSNPWQCSGLHMMSIGSILQLANPDSVVWGTGFISQESRWKKKPKLIYSSRGPLTRDKISELGMSCPKIYGDPALLTSRYIDSIHKPKAGQIGIIPHYVDKRIANLFENNKNIKIIDIETSDIYNFISEILECEVVASSSLHGIIISESFGIPSTWIKLSDGIAGGEFKFQDHYRGTGRIGIKPLNLPDITESNIIKNVAPKIKNINSIQSMLLEAFPSQFRGESL